MNYVPVRAEYLRHEQLIEITKRGRCPACGATSVQTVVTTISYGAHDQEIITMVRCTSCSWKATDDKDNSVQSNASK